MRVVRRATATPSPSPARCTRGGRSRAYLDGVVSSVAAVEAALRDRVAFYGQLEHARLLQLERQLDLLDSAAGLEDRAAAYAQAYAAARSLDRELERPARPGARPRP